MTGQQVVLRSCGQQHLATYMERIPLPTVVVDDVSGAQALGTLLACLVGLGALAVFGDGVVALVRDVH